MNIYESGSHNCVSPLVKLCCTICTAVCILSPHVCFILFVYHCEVCDRIQLRKVLYIGRGNGVIFTCLVAAFVTCVALKMESGVMN